MCHPRLPCASAALSKASVGPLETFPDLPTLLRGAVPAAVAPPQALPASLGGATGGGGDKAPVSDCLPLAAPIGLLPLLILTLCAPERVLVVSTEPPDDLSCLTTPGVGRPGDGAVARAVDQGHPDAPSESVQGFADPSTDLCPLGCVGN